MKCFQNELCRIGLVMDAILFNSYIIFAILVGISQLMVIPRLIADEVEANLIQIINTSNFPAPDPAGSSNTSDEANAISAPGLSSQSLKQKIESPDSEDIALEGRGKLNDLGASEILPGTWIGSGQCGRSDVTFKLVIRADLDNPGQVIVEAGGGFQPLNLKGGYDATSKRFKLQPLEWRIPAARNDPFELEMIYLPDANLLVIDRIAASGKCLGLAARKLQVLSLPPNPSGLLFKESPNLGGPAYRYTYDHITEEDCQKYALWWSSFYDPLKPQIGALKDFDGMNRVLGKNFWSWSNEDANRYRNLISTCRTKLKNTTDVNVALALQNIGNGWNNVLLRYPDKHGSEIFYNNALTQLYADLIEEIRLTQRRISEGLIGKEVVNVTESSGDWRGRLAAIPLHQFAGQWFGGVQCTDQFDPRGSTTRLLRLFVDDGVTPLNGRLDLGPYVYARSYSSSTAAVSLDVQYDKRSGDARLTMFKALGSQRDAPASLTINVKYDPATGNLTGSATGLSGPNLVCDQLDMKKIQRAPAPKEPDGILFQFYLRYGHTPVAPFLSVEQCDKFFRWQTEFETYKIGLRSFYGGLFDQERLRQVFGKDMYQWDEGDSKIATSLTRLCTPIITKDNKPDRLATMTKVTSSQVLYGWDVLRHPFSKEDKGARYPSLKVSSDWFVAEYNMREILSKAARFNTEITEIKLAKQTLGLIGRIDGLLAAITPRTGIATPYLLPSERDSYDSQLRALKVKAAIGVANTFLTSLSNRQETMDGLREAEISFQQMEQMFKARKFREGLAELQSGFSYESRRRALLLWPEHVQSTRKTFESLKEADLSHWRTLEEFQNTTKYLLKFIVPPKDGERIASNLAELEAKKIELGTAMLLRSEKNLVDWMQELPPSLGANLAVENFGNTMRKIGTNPNSLARLAAAMTSVKAAYNPLGLARPDIAGALMKRHWREVSLGGVEELAYFMTLTRNIETACPEVIKESMGASGEAALLAFAGRVSMEVTQRAMREGPRNRTEGMRMILLFFNTVANQPGCTFNQFGGVQGCTSQQDHFDTQEFIMTSSTGRQDADILTSSGCSGKPLQQYISGLSNYVLSYAYPGPGRPIEVPSFEDAVGTSQ